MSAVTLAAPIELGDGRSLRPPDGWGVKGVVADDPHRLQPNSRLVIEPPDGGASISWRVASWLVGKPDRFSDFEMVLDLEHVLDRDEIESLYPHVLRVLPENVREAKVHKMAGCGRVLSVTYLVEESGWAGHIVYMPSAEVEGELQLLSYEGKELAYLMHFEEALTSISSFVDERLRARL